MPFVARRWGIFALALVVSSPVLAQGTITLHSIQFVRSAGCWTSSPAADLTGVSTPLTDDHLFEVGWWFRIPGDPQETVFPAPDTQQYNGSHSTHNWNDVGGRGLFSAVEDAQIFDYSDGSPTGYVGLTMTLTNLNDDDPLSVVIFNMADFDVRPNSGDDSAALVEWTPNRILEIDDASGNFAQYTAFRNAAIPNHYIIRPYGATDVGQVLSDATVTNFADSGSPFGTGDFTAGWQFDFTLPAHGVLSASIALSVNVGSNCYFPFGLFCDGQERGDTTLWSAAVP